jgi:hypothetical protein
MEEGRGPGRAGADIVRPTWHEPNLSGAMCSAPVIPSTRAIQSGNRPGLAIPGNEQA